jgi:hypothetical protein
MSCSDTRDSMPGLQLTIVLPDHHLQGTFKLQSFQTAKLRFCLGFYSISNYRVRPWHAGPQSDRAKQQGWWDLWQLESTHHNDDNDEIILWSMELTEIRPQSPGKQARICPLRTSRLHPPRHTRCASRSTTLVSAIPVRLLLPAIRSRRKVFVNKTEQQTNTARCLHPFWKGSRGCFPHRSWARGCRYRRVSRRGRHERKARRPRCRSLVCLQSPSTTTPANSVKHTRMQRVQVLQVRQDQPLRQDPSNTG